MKGVKVFSAHLIKPVSTKMYQYRNTVFGILGCYRFEIYWKDNDTGSEMLNSSFHIEIVSSAETITYKHKMFLGCWFPICVGYIILKTGKQNEQHK